MANQYAIHDGNRVPGLLGHSSTDNSAETIRIVADSAGAISSAIRQDVTTDSNNSSVVALDAGDTFTGTKTSTLGVVGLQVSLKTDTNCTVYVDQSPDGTNWDISDEYEYLSSINNFGVTVQAINSYVRVRVKNTSTSNQSYLRLQLALCPVVSSLPRSLDSNGSLKVAVQKSSDEYGFEVENTPMGEMRTISPTRLVGSAFEGTTIDPQYWTATVAADGTIAQANTQIVLSTTTTSPNGSATLASYRRGRYVSGYSMMTRQVVQLSAGATNNKRRWGVGWGATMPTITDGAYFQMDGTTFSIVTLKGTTATKVDSGDFNGILGDTWTPGTTNYTYEIYWTNSSVWFVVGGKLLHTFSASTATWSNTMSHYVFMDNVNSSDLQTNHTLTCRVASIRRLGPLVSQPNSYYHASATTAGVQMKVGTGNLHGLIINNCENTAVITLSDSTTTTTPTIWAFTSGNKFVQPVNIDFKGLPFFNGLRLTISAAAASITAIYE